MISLLVRRPFRNRLNTGRLRRRLTRLLKILEIDKYDLSVVLTGDEEIQALNRDYRNKDKPTDVLSFPQLDEDEIYVDGVTPQLGDVVISVDTATSQAARGCLPRLQPVVDSIPGHKRISLAWSLDDEVVFLCLHGVLHLIGHDHETDKDADIMETLESELLPTLLTRWPPRKQRVLTE